MFITISRNKFHDMFRVYDCLDNFSQEGRDALFDFLEEIESDLEEGIELNVIALCCDYSEDLIENVLKAYNLESLEDLEDATQVIWHDDKNVLYLNY